VTRWSPTRCPYSPRTRRAEDFGVQTTVTDPLGVNVIDVVAMCDGMQTNDFDEANAICHGYATGTVFTVTTKYLDAEGLANATLVTQVTKP
jgi:hypothetical protein